MVESEKKSPPCDLPPARTNWTPPWRASGVLWRKFAKGEKVGIRMMPLGAIGIWRFLWLEVVYFGQFLFGNVLTSLEILGC